MFCLTSLLYFVRHRDCNFRFEVKELITMGDQSEMADGEIVALTSTDRHFGLDSHSYHWFAALFFFLLRNLK